MKRSRNLVIGMTAIVLGLIFGVFIGVRLGPLKSGVPSRSTPPPETAGAVVRPSITPAKPQSNSASSYSRRTSPETVVQTHRSTPTTTGELTNNKVLTEPPILPVATPENQISNKPKNEKGNENAPVVCVDPGHPSETSDGANAHGLSENRLNWQVALRLRDILEQRGIRCVLTKQNENQKVTNRERAEIANNARALVFVRLHCDVGSGRGFTWYYPDRTGSKQGVSGPPKDVQLASREAAFTINEAMKPVLKGHLQSNAIKTDASTFVGGKQGGVLTGSIFARVPTALIEMCYINEKHDAQFIASERGRNKMAEALARGIQAYINR